MKPFALLIVLLLTCAATFAADNPDAVAVAAPAPADPMAWKAELQSRLERKVTFEFVDQSLGDTFTFLGQLTKANLILDPEVTANGASNVTLKVSDMSLQNALNLLCTQANLESMMIDEALFLFPKGKYKLKPEALSPLTENAKQSFLKALPDLSSSEFETREKASTLIKSLGPAILPQLQLAQKTESDAEAQERLQRIAKYFTPAKLENTTPDVDLVLEKFSKKVTFDFTDTTLEDAAGFFAKLSNVPLTPDKTVMNKIVNLRVTGMPIGVSIKWLARLTGTRLVVNGTSLELQPEKAEK